MRAEAGMPGVNIDRSEIREIYARASAKLEYELGARDTSATDRSKIERKTRELKRGH